MNDHRHNEIAIRLVGEAWANLARGIRDLGSAADRLSWLERQKYNDWKERQNSQTSDVIAKCVESLHDSTEALRRTVNKNTPPGPMPTTFE